LICTSNDLKGILLNAHYFLTIQKIFHVFEYTP
jgi:hypothetical protein